MKYKLSIVFVLVLAVGGTAQEITKSNRTFSKLPGSMNGEIVISEALGNGLSNFKCTNFIVNANKLGGGWQRKARAYGDFSKQRCRFVVPNVPSGDPFVAVLNAQMPSCDRKTFDTTTSFPMKLKAGEAPKYNFSVAKISCELLK